MTPAHELERLFELSPDLLCIAGFDGYFKRVNPAFERTLGYTTEELLSRPFYAISHPDELERSRAAIETLSRGEKVLWYEGRYVCKDGSVRWLHWSTRPLPEAGLLFAAARDVTERRMLAEVQSAVRRVATRVAHGASSTEVFDAVAAEIERLLGADTAGLLRYEGDGTATIVAKHGSIPYQGLPLGTRVPVDDESVSGIVLRTGRSARLDGYEGVSGALADEVRRMGMHCVVGAPIVVDGRLWGVMATTWRHRPPTWDDVESRLTQFAELVGAAIANAESRGELVASRARVVAASDETRRRIERDLHDGTQQRLISLALGLRAAEEHVPPELPELRADLDRIARGLAGAVEELQEISRGLHPAILSRGGLGPALRTLARRAALTVEVDVQTDGKLPEHVEVAVYYVVSEAIENAARHAQAGKVRVELHEDGDTVRLSVHDDGVGGADPGRGSGLVGLRDRVEAAGGTMEVASYPGKGTSLHAAIPVGLS